MRERVADRAQGRWHGLLAELGIPAEALRGVHGPCPLCGGKDRYRFDDRAGAGTYYCSQCGAGDGFRLLMKFHAWTFAEAARRVEALVGSIPSLPAARPPVASARSLRALWAASVRVTPGDPVDQWLKRRVGAIEVPSCLRYVARCSHPDGGTHPAMVALVSDKDGKPATLHRTYLTEDGHKAVGRSPRCLMPGPVPDGGSVRLAPPGPSLGVAEGIETALSASILFRVPVWAALNEGQMAKWVPPAGVERVLIFGDADSNFTGQAAAYALAKRLARTHAVQVHIPGRLGSDWNDELEEGTL